MRKVIFILILFVIFVVLNSRHFESDFGRENLAEEIISSGNINLRITNNAVVGNPMDDDWPSLEWPINSGIDYLYNCNLWFGAKKIRRDESGNIYYWLPNPNSSDDVVTQNDPLWSPNLDIVVDTLTTSGEDGWQEIYEFLPAYNLIEQLFIGTQYTEYNDFDRPAKSIGQFPFIDDDGDAMIDEDEIGSQFVYPDPENIYCFAKPFDDDGDGLYDEDSGEPGFQTVRTFSYDFSPFGTDVERDFGDYASMSSHYPLNIGVEQNFYTWPVESYSNCLLMKTQILNASEIDTLYDFSFGYYTDADIGPQTWGASAIAPDDISSYIPGGGYDFAYSYDMDFDSGLTPGFIGLKNLYPDNLNEQCWSWSVYWGPDDLHPLQYFSTTNTTANEKYWLLTGRNPEPESVISIKDDPEYQIINYPNGVDTRFLSTVYGDMQGYSNPTPNSLNLEPGEVYEFYTLLFLGSSIFELKSNMTLMEDFIASDFDYSIFSGMYSIPYLYPLEQLSSTSINVKWANQIPSDEFKIQYKEIDANWTEIIVEENLGEYEILGLNCNCEYIVQVVADNIESNYETIELIEVNANNTTLDNPMKLQNYPNPFNPETSIFFYLSENLEIELDIYNIKGQKVKQLVNEQLSAGQHSVVWNGTDENNKTVPSGIYFYKLKTDNYEKTKRMILLK